MVLRRRFAAPSSPGNSSIPPRPPVIYLPAARLARDGVNLPAGVGSQGDVGGIKGVNTAGGCLDGSPPRRLHLLGRSMASRLLLAGLLASSTSCLRARPARTARCSAGREGERDEGQWLCVSAPVTSQDTRPRLATFGGFGVPKSRAAPSFLAASFGDLCLERVLGLPSAPHLNVYTNTLVPQAVLIPGGQCIDAIRRCDSLRR